MKRWIIGTMLLAILGYGGYDRIRWNREVREAATLYESARTELQGLRYTNAVLGAQPKIGVGIAFRQFGDCVKQDADSKLPPLVPHIFVGAVFRSSPADRAGVVRGMEVVAVNGKPVAMADPGDNKMLCRREYAMIDFALEQIQGAADPVVLTFLRSNGMTETLTLGSGLVGAGLPEDVGRRYQKLLDGYQEELVRTLSGNPRQRFTSLQALGRNIRNDRELMRLRLIAKTFLVG